MKTTEIQKMLEDNYAIMVKLRESISNGTAEEQVNLQLQTQLQANLMKLAAVADQCMQPAVPTTLQPAPATSVAEALL